jgi:hypothetical protein
MGQKIEFVKKAGSNVSSFGSLISKIFFIVVMLLALAFSGVFGNIGGMSQTIFGIVWLISFFMGIFSSPEARPALGLVMIMIALFTFTGMYSNTMGNAIFGYWWPQVESFGETFLGPLNNAWSQAQDGMGDAWLMMTNPQAYFIKIQQKQQATKSVVQEGGSVLSMERTDFTLSPSLPGTLEPQEPLFGNINIANNGEYPSDYLKLEIYASFKDSKTTGSKDKMVGLLKSIECSGTTADNLGINMGGSCTWQDTANDDHPIYPSETKMATFIFDSAIINVNGYGAGGWVELANTEPVLLEENGVETDIGDAYVYGGQTVKINANITYDYKVNVSIPVEVIKSERYIELVQNKQMQLIDLTSQYTGGPVKATLNSQKQPIMTGQKYMIVANIYNDGSGVIKKIESFDIKVPNTLVIAPNSIVTTFTNSAIGDGCTKTPTPDGDYSIIKCSHNNPAEKVSRYINRGEFKRVSFMVTPASLGVDIDRTTYLVTGTAKYTYLKTDSQSLTIAAVPVQ